MRKLSECKEGEIVTIYGIRKKGRECCEKGASKERGYCYGPMIRKRLLEMGFIKGKKVRIVKYAPLRDPMEVQLGDAYLSIRICEAEMIEVEP
ncbi:MAG: ferrous iron transport protein A [Chitinispirillaceae bacterium]|nr:ferrous iron transport protein A [Chitinispirillaceae bacterium]